MKNVMDGRSKLKGEKKAKKKKVTSIQKRHGGDHHR